MNEKANIVIPRPYAIKRYCQTLKLKKDDVLIEKYIDRHSEKKHWRVIREGIREIGIVAMEIYIKEDMLFMIVEVPMHFEWDNAFDRLKSLPMQEKWEEEMIFFQQSDGKSSVEKW